MDVFHVSFQRSTTDSVGLQKIGLHSIAPMKAKSFGAKMQRVLSRLEYPSSIELGTFRVHVNDAGLLNRTSAAKEKAIAHLAVAAATPAVLEFLAATC
jgi:hypothetical protein